MNASIHVRVRDPRLAYLVVQFGRSGPLGQNTLGGYSSGYTIHEDYAIKLPEGADMAKVREKERERASGALEAVNSEPNRASVLRFASRRPPLCNAPPSPSTIRCATGELGREKSSEWSVSESRPQRWMDGWMNGSMTLSCAVIAARRHRRSGHDGRQAGQGDAVRRRHRIHVLAGQGGGRARARSDKGLRDERRGKRKGEREQMVGGWVSACVHRLTDSRHGVLILSRSRTLWRPAT